MSFLFVGLIFRSFRSILHAKEKYPVLLMTAIPVAYPIKTPYGSLLAINADYTASGTMHGPIENFMRKQVYPFYANTHSNAHNGQLMAHYIEESKNLIRKSVNAKPCDRVVFTGNGCTGAIMHMIHLMNLRTKTNPETVVFVSVAEHHSNYLPWTHLPIKFIIIPVTSTGAIDTKILAERFIEFARHPKICSFIAGSNVTGVVQQVNAISRLVHQHGALIFWDFAGCGPYVPIDMHFDDISYFDAIILSPHKFLGGPGTPGVLVANHKVFKNEVPFCPGGGTVRFVSRDIKKYSDNLEVRESGGTPNILGCIKAGLVFQLKDELIGFITRRETEINAKVRSTLNGIKDIEMINPMSSTVAQTQVPIYSFRVKGLHYNFVVALLNDLFGVQTRGGVSCCSLFAHYLLSNNKTKQMSIYKQIVSNHGVPSDYGWCRVTFHYTMTDNMVDYILYAIQFVVRYGKMFLHEYEYEENPNRWVHRRFKHVFPPLSYKNIAQFNAVPLTYDILRKQAGLAASALSTI